MTRQVVQLACRGAAAEPTGVPALAEGGIEGAATPHSEGHTATLVVRGVGVLRTVFSNNNSAGGMIYLSSRIGVLLFIGDTQGYSL